MADIRVQRTIAAPPQIVFDYLADPTSLMAAPLALKAGFDSGTTKPAVGARRWLIGVAIWIRSEEITEYEPPRHFSYRIVKAVPAFRHDGGKMTFTPSGQGTYVDWRTS